MEWYARSLIESGFAVEGEGEESSPVVKTVNTGVAVSEAAKLSDLPKTNIIIPQVVKAEEPEKVEQEEPEPEKKTVKKRAPRKRAPASRKTTTKKG